MPIAYISVEVARDILDLFDEVKYKYVKYFLENYEDEECIEVEIEALEMKPDIWRKTRFRFDLPYEFSKTDKGELEVEVVKEYHNGSGVGLTMASIWEEVEEEEE